jgi:hypothetical protein
MSIAARCGGAYQLHKRWRQEDLKLEASWAKLARLCLKNKTKIQGLGVVQMVACLLSTYKALGSIPNATKQIDKQKTKSVAAEQPVPVEGILPHC